MNKKFTIGLIALIMATTIGLSTSVLAASDSNSFFGMFGRDNKPAQEVQQLTDAQRAEMQTKMTAVETALDAGNYDAWVTAVKAMDANSPLLTQVTADNFSEYLAKQQAREIEMTARKANEEAINTALDANNYEDWVAAVKAANEEAPILSKINADNFSQYVEAHNLKNKADDILKELGIYGREMGNFGDHSGGHGGLGNEMRGNGFGEMGNFNGAPVNAGNNQTTQN